MSDLQADEGFCVDGLASGDELGRSVAPAGDINGDGLGDLIVSAWRVDPDQRSDAGAVYVLFGVSRKAVMPVDLNALDGTNGFSIKGASPADGAGVSVGGAGDVNGDGFDDLVVGAMNEDVGGVIDAGVTYLLFGTSLPWPAAVDLSETLGSTGVRILGAYSGGRCGRSVTVVGDTNNDGFDEFAVCADRAPGDDTEAGECYVIFGHRENWPEVLQVSQLNGENGSVIAGALAGDRFGTSVSSAGDVNGDGNVDLLIGAPFSSALGASTSGCAAVVFGQAAAWPARIRSVELAGSSCPGSA